MNIGDTLKKLRMIYGFNAKEMSQQLSISASYLSEIENNRKTPTMDLLQKYSAVFDIKLSSLLLFSEEYSNSTETGDQWLRKAISKLINNFSKEIG